VNIRPDQRSSGMFTLPLRSSWSSRLLGGEFGRGVESSSSHLCLRRADHRARSCSTDRRRRCESGAARRCAREVCLASTATRGTSTTSSHSVVARNKGTKAIGAACSFGGETLVLMAHRTTKPIAKIEVGDMVLAQDPETGVVAARKVTASWVHDDHLVRLEIDGGWRSFAIMPVSPSSDR
jgi:hypothetical protein